jgi:phosphoserine phosphatase RsbU/P
MTMPFDSTASAQSRHRMECMELWGGSHETDTTVEMTGLRAHVYSHAYGDSTRGGDVYYFSSCASGRISRVLLADVTGHGKAVSDTAAVLRDVMRQSVNVIGQSSLMATLNQEFGKLTTAGGFATAVVVTHFSPTRSATISIAGHPPPLLYRSQTGLWSLVEELSTPQGSGVRDLPLGITDTAAYGLTSFRFDPGDRLLVYTDAFSESQDAHGAMLSPQKLQTIMNELAPAAAEEILPKLMHRLREWNPSNLTQDDATAILMEPTGHRIPMAQNLLAPWRMMRGVHEMAVETGQPDG